jgi:hypothetical protein
MTYYQRQLLPLLAIRILYLLELGINDICISSCVSGTFRSCSTGCRTLLGPGLFLVDAFGQLAGLLAKLTDL